jgi:transcriptional regulator with XRE-family HTH domain
MPSTETSAKRRRFGLWLGPLRESHKESQEQFAKRLGYSRTVIANTENGEPPSANLIAKLIEHFPEHKSDIEYEVKRWATARTQRTRHQRLVRQRLDVLLAANEPREASEYLKNEIDAHVGEIAFLVWALEQRSVIERLRNRHEASRNELLCAIHLVKLNPDFEPKLSSLWEQLALSLYEDGRRYDAHAVLNMGLATSQTPASLWYRKGVIHWDEGDLSSALAALTAALDHRGPHVDILYVRAQIFAEWERPDEALADIAKILKSRSFILTPPKAVCMRCTRAYAQFLKVEPKRANVELPLDWGTITARIFSTLADEAAKTPESPWPYYFRALCVKSRYDLLCSFVEKSGRLHEAVSDDIITTIAEMQGEIRNDLMRVMDRDNRNLGIGQYRVRRVETILASLDGNQRKTD